MTERLPMTLIEARDTLLRLREHQTIESDITEALDFATTIMGQLKQVEEVNVDLSLPDSRINLEMRLDEAKGDAVAMANAFRDLFNNCGADTEVRDAYESVEQSINNWEGRQ